MQSQPNQSGQFTQSELQQIKAVLSRQIKFNEMNAAEAKYNAGFWKDRGDKENKDISFVCMRLQLNKAKKLAKLQKKVKNLISGKESF